jgi:hypothetical protein
VSLEGALSLGPERLARLQERDIVIYSDVDIYVLGDYLPYVTEVLKHFDACFQSESLNTFPPTACAGFMAFRKSRLSSHLLRTVLSQKLAVGSGSGDQDVLNRVIYENYSRLKNHIYFLPESLFANGLNWRNFLPTGTSFNEGVNGADESLMVSVESMKQSLSPFLFHANWLVGLPAKKRLLSSLGMWNID